MHTRTLGVFLIAAGVAIMGVYVAMKEVSNLMLVCTIGGILIGIGIVCLRSSYEKYGRY